MQMKQPNLIARNALLIYFVVSIGCSALIAWVSFATGNENISILIPLSPSILAILVTVLGFGRHGLSEMFRGRILGRLNVRWSLIALLLVPIVAAGALLTHSFFGGPPPGLRTTQLMPQVIVILLISLGEEIGWRGFALPRLQKRFSALNASLVLGLVWGFWHFPGYLIGTGVPMDMPFAVFLLWVVLATILITWVYNNTGGSILSAILMHSAANATFNYLPLLPEFTGQMTTFIIFLGLIFVVTVFVVVQADSLNKKRVWN